MAFVNVGGPGGFFDGISGSSWALGELNYAVFLSNSSTTGIISITALRITTTGRQSGFSGELSIGTEQGTIFDATDDSGSTVTTFTFSAPYYFSYKDDPLVGRLELQYIMDYFATTIVSVEAEGTGDLFGTQMSPGALYKLSDLSRRWVKNMVWVGTGYWKPDSLPPPPVTPPSDPIGGNEPIPPYNPCPSGYHLVSFAILEGPYLSPPYYRTTYHTQCVKD